MPANGSGFPGANALNSSYRWRFQETEITQFTDDYNRSFFCVADFLLLSKLNQCQSFGLGKYDRNSQIIHSLKSINGRLTDYMVHPRISRQCGFSPGGFAALFHSAFRALITHRVAS
jgi:hypothetical protein